MSILSDASDTFGGEGEGAFKRKYLSEKLYIISGVIELIVLSNMVSPIKIMDFSQYITINESVNKDSFFLFYVLSFLIMLIVKIVLDILIRKKSDNIRNQKEKLINNYNEQSLDLELLDKKTKTYATNELLNLIFACETIVIVLYFAVTGKIYGVLQLTVFIAILIRLVDSIWYNYYSKAIRIYQTSTK